MFRLHKSKHSPLKPAGENFNFKFSEFEVIQVPKGWDKLLVSIISVETGKTLAKTSKAFVRNGNCQWTDSISDSIWIPTKENQGLQDCPYKLLVSMGSARSGILGEAVVNMAIYMSSSDSFPVSFLLNKCSHGTILQLEIQCLTPRIMDNSSKLTRVDFNISSNETETKSGDSDNTLVKSAQSYSSKDLSSHSQEEEDEKVVKGTAEEGSFRSLGSHNSYISVETSDGFGKKPLAKQDSTCSHNSDHLDHPSRNGNSESIYQDDPQDFGIILGSSRRLLEAAEDTIEDLRSEVKHWERSARKLTLDLEVLSKQCSEQSKSQVDLSMELSAMRVERDCLLKEVEHLNQLLQKASESEHRAVQDNGLANVVKGMEDEIRILKETNDMLTQQLYRTQESNFELVSMLQELEESAETKKDESGDFQGNVDNSQGFILQVQQLQESETILRAKVQELEKELEGKSQDFSEGSEVNGNLVNQIDSLKGKLQELERDCQELTDENIRLLLEIKEMKRNSDADGTSIGSMPDKGKHHESEIHELKEKIAKIETDHSLEVQVLEWTIAELNTELSGKRAEVDALEEDLISKENEIRNLRTCQARLEEKLSEIQDENGKLEENVEAVAKESDIATKCLKTQVSAKKVLERKSSELEDGNRDLEVRLSELKQENEELLDCVSMLEAQIQNLADDRKSIALELHNSRSNSVTLQDEIARLRNEMQVQETDARRKLAEIASQWSEAQEELETLREENPKLQASTESLIKNCGSLQNSVRQLRIHNVELQEHCDALDAKLSEAQRNFADCLNRVNDLRERLCSLVDESTTKERILTSELDALVKENDGQSKKLIVLDQMHMEKSEEVENLRGDLEELNKQLRAIRDEKENLASDSAKEMSDLSAHVSELETELEIVKTRSKASIEDLMDELASSKQNQETLKTEMAKMSHSLENYRSCEENFKVKVDSLELKLRVSEHEQQQLIEETEKMKARLLELESLEEEVVTLRDEKKKLETSLKEMSEECKELNMEKSSCIDKITVLQKDLAEMEDGRNDKFVLEERIQQLESSLIANEAICDQDIELRKELSRTKISNKQLQQQILQLQEEKLKLKARIKSLDEELILIKEKQRNLKGSNSFNSLDYQVRREGDQEFSRSKESNYEHKFQLKRMASENIRSKIRCPKNSRVESEFVAKDKFERTKASLEAELRDLQERYSDMSLKYAQGEAQREELVMKLRVHSNGRRCF